MQGVTPAEASAPRPPGPAGLPGLGNALQLARAPLAFPERCVRTYGDVVGFRFAGQSAVLLGHPDGVKHVLAEHPERYWKGAYFNRQLELLGDGLFAADGPLWHRQRRLMQPIFHPNAVASYGADMVEATQRVVEGWRPGEPTRVDEAMMRLALGNVANALFNVDVLDEVPGIARAIDDVMGNFRRSRRLPVSLPPWLPTPGRRRYDRAVATFDAIVEDVVASHREADEPPDDVVSLLLAATDEAGRGMSDAQIRDEVLTLLLAGHDTTGLGLTYTWHALATHPEVDARLAAELDAVLGGRPPTVGDLDDLPYLSRVLKETLRLYPPVYFFVREPYEDDVVGGYRVPAGSLVLVYQWLLHRDPRFFDDPESFDPDRWTGAFERELHPFAYLPFGGGPRRCIGEGLATMELELVVATIAQRYRLTYAGDPPLSFDPMMSLRPDGPVTMVPRPR